MVVSSLECPLGRKVGFKRDKQNKEGVWRAGEWWAPVHAIDRAHPAASSALFLFSFQVYEVGGGEQEKWGEEQVRC